MAQTDTIGRAGEHYVAAELNRRGAYASPFSGNVPGIDIVATDSEQKRMVYIQVKTKRFAKHRWRASLGHGWKIPQAAKCLCIDTCDAARCKEATGKEPTHPHHPHPHAYSLLALDEKKGKPDHYWVFVSLEGLRYWVVPDDTVRSELIRQPYIKYLEERGGHRPGPKHDSWETSIREPSLTAWLGRWSALPLSLEDFVA